MSISFKRYIDLTSGVGGGAAVRAREFILRLFTNDPRVPEKTVIEMTSSDDAATYFGSTSEEYKRVAWYMSFVSKLIKSPTKVSFSRWAETAAAANIFGASKTFATSTFTPVSAGSLNLTLGAYSADITGIDFSTATTLSDVAATLQAAIRAVIAGGSDWTAATVVYDAVNQRFTLTGGVVGAEPVAVTDAATGAPIASLLGWDSTGVFSPGVDAQEPLDAFLASVQVSDNFGSFAFIPAITLLQATAVASQNKTYNVKFMFLLPLTQAQASSYYAALKGYGGVGMTLSPLATEYPELLPAAVMASTDYSKENSVQNYMFQVANLTQSVDDDPTADAMDAARVNYYGRTQSAGQGILFYQRGTLTGLDADPAAMNVYANEMWLKDAAGVAIMSLLLAMAKVSANASGRSQLLVVLQGVIKNALFNGTISVDKPLNVTQKLYIGNMTGDDLAWHQVQTLGYWVDCVLQSYVGAGGDTEWKAVYTLIYAKDDAIRKVEGTHVLI